VIKKKKLIFRLIILFCIVVVIYRLNGVRLHIKGDLNFSGSRSTSVEENKKVFLYVYLKYLGENLSYDELNKLIPEGESFKSIEDLANLIDKYSCFKIPKNLEYIKKCIDHKVPVIIFSKKDPLFIIGYNSISGKFIVIDSRKFIEDSYLLSMDINKISRIDKAILSDFLKESEALIILKKYSDFYENEFERESILKI